MDKSHIWIEHHRVGPAVFHKCLRCKRFAFYLEYDHKRDIPGYNKDDTIEQKFLATVKYIEKYYLSLAPFSLYFTKQEVLSLKEVVKLNCNELDVKDILT